MNFVVGDFVSILPFGPVTETRRGVCRFIGETDFAPDMWVGVELVGSTGKNTGVVAGRQYFECLPGQGVFVRPELVELFAPPAAPRGFDMDLRADLEEARDALAEREAELTTMRETLEALQLDLEIATEEKLQVDEERERLEVLLAAGGGSGSSGGAAAGGGGGDVALEVVQLRRTIEILREERDVALRNVTELKEAMTADDSADAIVEQLSDKVLSLEEQNAVLLDKVDELTRRCADFEGLVDMQDTEMREQAGQSERIQDVLQQQLTERDELLSQLDQERSRMRARVAELEEELEVLNIDGEQQAERLAVASSTDDSRGRVLRLQQHVSATLAASCGDGLAVLGAMSDALRCVVPRLAPDVDVFETIAELGFCSATAARIASAFDSVRDSAGLAPADAFDLAAACDFAAHVAESWLALDDWGVLGELGRRSAALPAACLQMLQLASDGAFNKSWRQIFAQVHRGLCWPPTSDNGKDSSSAAGGASSSLRCPSTSSEDALVARVASGAAEFVEMLATLRHDLRGLAIELPPDAAAVMEATTMEAKRLVAFVQALGDARDAQLLPALAHTATIVQAALAAADALQRILREKLSDVEHNFCDAFPLAEFARSVVGAFERPPVPVPGDGGSCLGALLAQEISVNALPTMLEGCVARIQREWNAEVRINPPTTARERRTQGISKARLLDRAAALDQQLFRGGGGGSSPGGRRGRSAPGASSGGDDDDDGGGAAAAELQRLRDELAKLQKDNWRMSVENKALEPTKAEIRALTERLQVNEEEHRVAITKLETDYEQAFAARDEENSELRAKLQQMKQDEGRTALSPLSHTERRELQLHIAYLQMQLAVTSSGASSIPKLRAPRLLEKSKGRQRHAAGAPSSKYSTGGADEDDTHHAPAPRAIDALMRATSRLECAVMDFASPAACSSSCGAVYRASFVRPPPATIAL